MNTTKNNQYKILMLVHDRPLYTYMTLDSLRRATYSPYHLTVIHHKTNPGPMDDVLKAFLRRGVVHSVYEMRNALVDWEQLRRIGHDSLDANDEFLFFIEDDVVIEKSDTCWLASMARVMHSDPKLAFLGSAIDKSDFIDPEALSKEVGRSLTKQEMAIIKAYSPERRQAFEPGQEIMSNHNVPGRLFCLRLSAATEDIVNVDSKMDSKLRSMGWKTAVTNTVVHRHMSLQNYYDYPAYYEKRNKHIENLDH